MAQGSVAAPNQGKVIDARSKASSVMTKSVAAPGSDSELDEEDEWAAIQKFNALLHYEEQKQAAIRVAERKRLMKQELDSQVAVK